MLPSIHCPASTNQPGSKERSEGLLNYITLHPDEFIIFFPFDIHQPELFIRQPAPVKKVVVKVKV